jgi:hypothetical protein
MKAWLVTVNHNWHHAVIARNAVEAMSQGGDLWREVHTGGKDIGGIEDIDTRYLILAGKSLLLIERLTRVLIFIAAVNIGLLVVSAFFRDTAIFWPLLLLGCLTSASAGLTAALTGRHEAGVSGP